MIQIRSVAGADATSLLRGLSGLLVRCVRAGASVEFLSSVTLEDAWRYWTEAISRVDDGQQVMLVATEDDVIVGTVSLVLARQQNQQHRCEISKLLVDPQARRRGIGNRLMDAVEAEAWARGRTVLVLDTVTGSEASHLYERRGWNRVGQIPDYARDPAGEMCSTTYYWKRTGLHSA